MSAQETKVVPVEPTEEMINAGMAAWTGCRKIYKAMLAAAPSSEPATDNGELARLRQRVLELESWIDAYCAQPDQTKMYDKFNAMKDRAEAAEAKLARIGALEAEWREEDSIIVNECADELRAELEG